jgi:hypothetical protein
MPASPDPKPPKMRPSYYCQRCGCQVPAMPTTEPRHKCPSDGRPYYAVR